MSKNHGAKGTPAEREIAAILSKMTGWPVGRMYCEGIAADRGDLRGVPGHCVQVANMRNLTAAARRKVAAVESQRLNYQQVDPTICHGVAMIRLHRVRTVDPWDRWRVVFSADQAIRYFPSLNVENLLAIATPPGEFQAQLRVPASVVFSVSGAPVGVCRMARSSTCADEAATLRLVALVPHWIMIAQAAQQCADLDGRQAT